jgi:exosortase
LIETAVAVDPKNARREAYAGLLAWIKVAVIAGLVIALYAAIITDLASEWWTSDASSYGMLVPPIALYLAYRRREVTFAIPAQPDPRGLALLSLACFVLLLGKLSSEYFLARSSLVLVLGGIVWTFWGFRRFRTLFFPLVLLGTMVPLPILVFNTLAAPLQLFASRIATDLAQMFGVSIYREGNIIHLATTSLGVAEACSGLNSLSSLVVASLLLGFLADATVLGRILLVVLSLPLAIAVNVLRVTGTAVLADYRPDFAIGFYHSFSGWLIFLVGFGALGLLGKLIFRWTRANP